MYPPSKGHGARPRHGLVDMGQTARMRQASCCLVVVGRKACGSELGIITDSAARDMAPWAGRSHVAADHHPLLHLVRVRVLGLLPLLKQRTHRLHILQGVLALPAFKVKRQHST